MLRAVPNEQFTAYAAGLHSNRATKEQMENISGKNIQTGGFWYRYLRTKTENQMQVNGLCNILLWELKCISQVNQVKSLSLGLLTIRKKI